MDNTIVVSQTVGGPTPSGAWADRAGLLASLACAVHCAAMPIVIGYLPSLGLSWMAGERFHQWMAVICAVIAFLAFVPGLRRHRRFAPIAFGMVGIGLLTSAAFFFEACCASCETLQASTDTGCETCNALGETCDSVAATTASSETTILSFNSLTKYATPLGGCVLIVAHLLNHRLGCRCCAAAPVNVLVEEVSIEA